MGLEYKVKFQISDRRKIENVLKRISTSFSDEVTVDLEEDGFYFCDNLIDSSVASKVFYRLIKEILSENDEVAVSEL